MAPGFVTLTAAGVAGMLADSFLGATLQGKYECPACDARFERGNTVCQDRKSTRLNSSHSQISYAVFCLKKKNHDHDPLDTDLLDPRLDAVALAIQRTPP